jgi:hypothetical protein
MSGPERQGAMNYESEVRLGWHRMRKVTLISS